jgi:gamma-butyrobetaine dioxygenase
VAPEAGEGDAEGDAVDGLLAPLLTLGGAAYLGEPVTQLQHALQTADRAARAGAAPALVAGALLHDVGWLLGAGDIDHAARSAAHLRRWFPAEASEPVRLHVDAKRWLCTTSPGYHDLLSEASKRTLALQGGLMDTATRAAFEADAWSSHAVQLRRWDDEAKVPGREVPGLDHWRPLVAVLLTSR